MNEVKSCTNCGHLCDRLRFCPNCGQNLHLPKQDRLEGTIIAGNYQILEKLSDGAAGAVYRAEQINLGKPVAIKLLHPHLQRDPGFQARFQREALAASRLNHPNCISIIDFGQTEQGAPFLVMEYVRGKSLRNLIKEEFPILLSRIVRILSQVCSALDEAHSHQVIHRDLKPDNILIEERRSQKDFVTIVDFGIAKIQSPDPSPQGDQLLTQIGEVRGTPQYMSPEQARGDTLDGRSDLYSVGVIFFEMVTGVVPFEGESPIVILTKHLNHKPPAPSQLRPDLKIPPKVDQSILYCLNKHKKDRPTSAAALQELLLRLIEEPGLDQPSTSPSIAFSILSLEDYSMVKTDPDLDLGEVSTNLDAHAGYLNHTNLADTEPEQPTFVPELGLENPRPQEETEKLSSEWKREAQFFKTRQRQRAFLPIIITLLLTAFGVTTIWIATNPFSISNFKRSNFQENSEPANPLEQPQPDAINRDIQEITKPNPGTNTDKKNLKEYPKTIKKKKKPRKKSNKDG